MFKKNLNKKQRKLLEALKAEYKAFVAERRSSEQLTQLNV